MLKMFRSNEDRRLSEIRELLKHAQPLDNSPPNQLDEDGVAVEYGCAFFWRFGFKLDRAARIALMEMKKRHRITDLEVKKLYFSGNLKRGINSVSIDGDTTKAVAGWAGITFIGLTYIGPVYAALSQSSILSGVGLKALLAFAVFFVSCWCLYQLFILPRKIRQRGFKEA